MESMLLIALYALVTLTLGWVIIVVLKKPKDSISVEDTASNKSETKSKRKKTPSTSESTSKKASKGKASTNSAASEAHVFSHEYLASTLKGHSSNVVSMDVSPNGKFLASCGDTVFVWLTKDFNQRDHKSIRGNIEFDSASRVVFSPDNKAYLISKAEENTIEVFKLGKKSDGSIGNIQSAMKYKQVHPDRIIALGIACNGKFVMSCSSENKMVIWDLKGNILTELNTGLRVTYSAKVSPFGRYVIACGASPEVIVYNVNFDPNTGEYQRVTDGWRLKGHGTSVCNFDINVDSSIIVQTRTGTVVPNSYAKNGNSSNKKKRGDNLTTNDFLLVNHYDQQNEENNDGVSAPLRPPAVSLSHDSRILFGVGKTIYIFSSFSARLLETIEQVHSNPIIDLRFSLDDKYFISCGDRMIRVFHNVPGFYELAGNLREQIKDPKVTGASKTRLGKELEQLEKVLQNFKKTN